MHSFPLDGAARLVVSVPSAVVDVSAVEGATEVTVLIRAARPGRTADLKAAERIETTMEAGTVTVRSPETLGRIFTIGQAVVTVTLPSGTPAQLRTANGAIRLRGDMGACTLSTSNGSIDVESAASLEARTSNGAVDVGRVDGEVSLSSASGEVVLASAGGPARLKSSNGALRIGDTPAGLSAKTSNGSIVVASTSGIVELRTSVGGVRVGSMGAGELRAKTSTGDVEVAVAPGLPVWVDAHTGAGVLHNDLTPLDAPSEGPTTRLELHTSAGSLRLTRAIGSGD